MTNFGTGRTVVCGAPTPAGPCSRRVIPGRSCGFHDPVPVIEQPLIAVMCRCAEPVIVGEEDLPARCLLCGRAAPNERPEVFTHNTAAA